VIVLFPLRAGRPAERAGFTRFVRFYALYTLRFFLVFSFFTFSFFTLRVHERKS
jgi:hypothetical protein